MINYRRFTKVSAERGAILPITALILILLLAFAALTVDLGAAWAERRADQTAADAAAMAGAIEYVRSNPTEAEVVAVVKDYVERNIGYPATAPGWATCPAPTDGFQPLAGNNCVSLKQASTDSNDTLLKVRIPDQILDTFFASVIGFDTIAVSAKAVARIEQNPGLQGALPFVIPLHPGEEYCIGTPPGGQARSMCDGPSNGLFGTAESEFFGAAEDPWGTTSCVDSPANPILRGKWNTALGIDHFLRIAPTGADPALGADQCDATSDPSYIPYSILAKKGNMSLIADGFIGDAVFGSIPSLGRLRQGGGTPPLQRHVPEGTGTIRLDNVGLWEYLVEPSDSTDACHSTRFDGTEREGTELTSWLLEQCFKHGTVKFTKGLLDSPRFAIVPQLDVSQADIGDLGPTETLAINIVKFMPVYLQATWFNCSGTECMYFDSDDGDELAFRPEVFEPGEGSLEGCVLDGAGCKKNVTLALDGISAIILGDDAWLPDEFNNQFNDPGAYNVYLYE